MLSIKEYVLSWLYEKHGLQNTKHEMKMKNNVTFMRIEIFREFEKVAWKIRKFQNNLPYKQSYLKNIYALKITVHKD
jgi:hypothetical protein